MNTSVTRPFVVSGLMKRPDRQPEGATSHRTFVMRGKLPFTLALGFSLLLSAFAQQGYAAGSSPAFKDGIAVGPQYDTTHVYVRPEDFDKFVASLIATFGGTQTKEGVFTVTPTASLTMSQLVLTPVGSISVFGFKTPVPFPFGAERTGYLVKDLDAAVSLARPNGASVIVAPFPDPIGRDVVVQWPGGVNMQLYWHTLSPNYAEMKTVPENRVYIAADRAQDFIDRFVRFSHGRVIDDSRSAPGIEIGRPGDTYREAQIESLFGKVRVLVTDGHLPYPYGHELAGYEVSSLSETLDKAKSSGAQILVAPFASRGRDSAVIQFPGGYIAEIHDVAAR